MYWIRSLVPIDRKSKCFRKVLSVSAAAGISIMAPSLTGPYTAPRLSSSARAKSISDSVWRISLACASIGMSRWISPCAAARRMARSCVRNIAGSARLQRMARRPSAGFRCSCLLPDLPSSGLSAPTSMVRMVTGMPCMPSTARL
ncbi:hypothetical protein D9M70_550260 [compost metagenome]